MNKIILTFIFIFLASCSLNKNSKLWNEKDKEVIKEKKQTKILVEEKKELNELNAFISLNLSVINYNNKITDNLNNFGSLKYNGSLNKIGKYNFSKLVNFNQFNSEPLILNDGLIIFDKKGTILRYNDNQKITWKNNFYSKSEKKLNPLLTFATNGNNLLVADNISNIFSIDIFTGSLIWSQKSNYPFNSQIKIYKDKFFLIDYKNTLKCFYLKDGKDCWEVQTDESFTVSSSKYSLIIKDNMLVFNNSIGDITAVDILTGLIEWQLPTQKSSIINDAYNFNFSKLVSDGESIYFSNNKNEFYSIDIKSGAINWINQVSSNLTPIIIKDYIFTISDTGYLVNIQKKEGNIIRIKDIYKNYDIKKRKKIKPSGFSIGQNKLYLSNSDGNLMVIDLNSGNLLKVEKVSRNLISKPYIYNGNLFIVKNGSVIQYD
ncbi:outer membrane protein assembly factor BamB family protein [Candidatus Pelagibacter sp. HIMB1483]|uniref:PQQ-binding-like beta-propeller repeat protein n=1 Tax=Candidatus Pelagibacter sp. HIMB1483 TaxID=3415414 RepID=UPI003F8646A8